MKAKDSKEKRIIALAYFHRYGWIAAVFACAEIFKAQFAIILSVSCMLFSVWTFVGYMCRWKHIYCSYQNAYRQKMTPRDIRWHRVKKSDAYLVPAVFFVVGLGLLLTKIF